MQRGMTRRVHAVGPFCAFPRKRRLSACWTLRPMYRLGSKNALGSDNADGLGFGIEYDLRLAAFELADDVRHLILQRELFFSVVRSLAQYVGFDHSVQQVRRQLGQRNHYGMRSRVLHVQSSLRAHARYG